MREEEKEIGQKSSRTNKESKESLLKNQDEQALVDRYMQNQYETTIISPNSPRITSEIDFHVINDMKIGHDKEIFEFEKRILSTPPPDLRSPTSTSHTRPRKSMFVASTNPHMEDAAKSRKIPEYFSQPTTTRATACDYGFDSRQSSASSQNRSTTSRSGDSRTKTLYPVSKFK